MTAEKITIKLTEEQVRLALNVLADTAQKWEDEAHRGPNGGLTKLGRGELRVAEQMRELHAAIDEERFRDVLRKARLEREAS